MLAGLITYAEGESKNLLSGMLNKNWFSNVLWGRNLFLFNMTGWEVCISNHFHWDPSISQMTDHAPSPLKLDFSLQTPGIRASKSPMTLQ